MKVKGLVGRIVLPPEADCHTHVGGMRTCQLRSGGRSWVNELLRDKTIIVSVQRRDHYHGRLTDDPAGLRPTRVPKEWVNFAPDRLPTLDEIKTDTNGPLQPWDGLVLLAAAIGFDILDREAPLRWSLEEMDAALRWMSYVSASANDHVVRRKNLVPPPHTVGVLK